MLPKQSFREARHAASLRRRQLVGFVLLALVSLGNAGCAAQPSPQGVSVMELNQVAAKTIFFGHQSVGWNIIQGIEELLQAQPGASLTLTQAENLEGMPGPAFFHSEVGENGDPLSKLQAFERLVRAGIGERADVAFFKFCYVDFDQNTDVAQLFTAYQQTMAALSRDYPQTTLVYVTTPLTTADQGVKAVFKSLLGRNEVALANLKRQQFNELLRREYAGTGALFDLAASEATDPAGNVCSVTVAQQTVPCLVAAYSDDGGHLNERGRQVVATQLLKFLARLD